MCDVGYSMLLERAATADMNSAVLGGPTDHVPQLHRALGMPNDSDEGEDADVIVLAEYRSLQDLANELFAPPAGGG